MTGVIVSHPLFGRGQVLEVRNAAREAVVRFDNGIRAVVQRNMLAELDVPGAKPLPIVAYPASSCIVSDDEGALGFAKTAGFAASVFLSLTRPPVMAAAIKNVPVSIRSGTTR